MFDILGEVFEERSLKELLIEAIRYGDQPDVRARLGQRIEGAMDRAHLQRLLDRNALAQETMSAERLFAVREEMEKAEARRLQPFFVRAFFLKAMERLGGTVHPREAGRWEVTHVPAAVRERDRMITGRNRREMEPVLKRYERICFDREAVQPIDRPGLVRAVLMHPGHPLMQTLGDLLLEQHANLLRQGALLVDPTDEGDEPHLLFLLTHEVKSADGAVLSRRMHFVRIAADGTPSFGGWAPHLDLEPISDEDRVLVADVLSAPWVRGDQESRAMELAATTLVPGHYDEVAGRRVRHVDRTLNAVHERLTKEIAFWQDRWVKLRKDLEDGRDVRLNVDNARRTIAELEARLDSRKSELRSMRHVMSGTPVVLGAALVVPKGLLDRRRGEAPTPGTFAASAAARARIERLAMETVERVETSRGCSVSNVAHLKCGWDLTVHPPTADGAQPEPLHVEVKGRIRGADTVTVTRNEILYAFNQGDKFVLAIVLIGEDNQVEGPYYLRRPFDREPGWGVASINFRLRDLLDRAELQTV